MFANVFKKDEELVVKANPYHGAGGRFSTQSGASFVSTGGVFAKTNQKSKDQWDSESRSTQPKDRAKGAKQIKDVLAGPAFGWDGKTSGTSVKAKGDKVTIKEPIFSSEKKVVDRNREQAEKDWDKGGLYSKFFNDDHGIEVSRATSRVTGDGSQGKRRGGKEVPPYYLETDVYVASTKKKKSTRKISGLGVDMGLISKS